MNCPFCGALIEDGNVTTADSIGLFFMPKGIDPNRAFNTTRGIEKKGGVVLDGPYSGGNFRLNNTAIPGHICKACRRIVMEY